MYCNRVQLALRVTAKTMCAATQSHRAAVCVQVKVKCVVVASST